MNKKMYLCLILSTVMALGVYGQDNLKKASKQFDLGRYDLAVENYEKGLQLYPNDYGAISKLALCHLKLKNYKKSEKLYSRIISRNESTITDKLNYAKVLKRQNNIDEAINIYNEILRTDVTVGTQELARVEFSKNIPASEFEIQPYGFNTKYSDFGTSSFDNSLVFQSFGNQEASSSDIFSQDNTRKFGTYIADDQRMKEWNTDNVLANKGFVSESVESGIYTYAITNFAIDDFISFEGMSSAIYFYNSKNDKIESFPYNMPGVVNAFPFLTESGDALFFTSNREGGLGGFDLYVSYLSNGTWTDPQNLGNEINTKGNELSCHVENGDLYFSSDYHYGVGGYDIFKSSKIDSQWSKPKNLGFGVNSQEDEWFPFYQEKNLYFTSTRPGGLGSADIYVAREIHQEMLSLVPPPAELIPSSYMSELESSSPNVVAVSDVLKIEVLELSEEKTENLFSLEGARLVSVGELLPATSVYFIQIAALYSSEANTDRFRSLSPFGNIYKIYKDNAVKIQLGYYYDENQARQVLSNVKKHGFRDAFITYGPLNTSSLELIVSSSNSQTNSPSTTNSYTSDIFGSDNASNKSYKVRLAAYEDPIWFDTNKVKDLGRIEQWSKGAWTIFILGGYTSYEEAQRAHIQAVNRGFVDSEVVIDRGGILERIKSN